jgi:DICT domain-containing protein
MNPDEHLTEEQRELLVSAEYYDRLNAATAYFPSTNVALGQDVE